MFQFCDSLQASCPIWASEMSLAKTREWAVKTLAHVFPRGSQASFVIYS